MDRFFLFLMSLLLVGVVCCSGKEKDGSYGQGNFQERSLSRSKRSGRWHQSCTCPDLGELQNPKQQKYACPCNGFNLSSLSEHHHHHHPRKTRRLWLHKRDKCRKFLRHCAFKGIHIPL
ncbi:uncharacterized protein PHA67_003491 [Liasis olivaceus]